MPEESQQYVVTARKWRPQRFADVVGQEHVTRTLRNAVESKRIHHAYIFNGPRGVGKTTTARILAKAVNCENMSVDFEPCNECASCQEINSGRSMDVIEIDGASNNSVDDIRKLRENAKYPPIKGAYKMYIIDEVHMLSTSAFNALLKTLEEPPKHLLFVFATTEPHKVPATILSRCQRFDFRRMQVDEIAAQLRYIATQEAITIDDESLAVIGKKGDGSMRDSQSIFDQVIAFCGKHVEYSRVNEALNLIDQEFYFTLSKAIRDHDVAKTLDIAREVFMRGYDLQECLSGLAEHFRNILTVLATGDTKLIEASKLHREQYAGEAALFKQADVLQFMSLIIATERDLRFAPQPRLRFEFALVQMAKMDSAVQISELLGELAELKKKLETFGLSAFGGTIQPNLAAVNSPQASPDLVPSLAEQPVTAPLANNAASKNFERDGGEGTETLGVELSEQASQGAPKHVSAEALAQQWQRRLSTMPDLDPSVRLYLLNDVQVRVECADNEVFITHPTPALAELLHDKQEYLERTLAELFNASVRVVVRGAAASTASIFGDYASEIPQVATILAAPSLAASQTHPTTNGHANQVASLFNDASNDTSDGASNLAASFATVGMPAEETFAENDTGDHELDHAIRSIFGAVKIPLR